MARSSRAHRGRSPWELSWAVIGLLGAVTLVLGTWGFERYAPAAPVTDHIYRTLQLTVFESGDLTGTIPWQLEVARVLAPILVAYSVVRSLLLLSRDRLDTRRAQRAADHIVVCGLGERGTLVTAGLCRDGHQVVAIERERSCRGIEDARHAGAVVLVGDAADEHILRRAGVTRATHLLAFCGEPGVDAEVVLAARRVSTGRRDALTCRMEVDEPALADLLEQLQLGEHYEHTFHLDVLDLWGSAARELVRRFPPTEDGDHHVVVVGLGRFGGSVATELARRHHAAHPDAEPLRVSVFDPVGEAKVAGLVNRLPHLRAACRFEVHAAGAADQGGDDLKVLLRSSRPGAVYVCLGDEVQALAVGLQCRSWLQPDAGIVAVKVRRHGGLAEALEEIAGEHAGIHTFAALDAALAPDLVLGGRMEQIARALHEEYRAARPGGPADVAWDELPASLRASNRDQAQHVGVKLRAAGCRLVPLESWGAGGFAFGPDELDVLARLEHERWVAERAAAGWTPGPRREGATTSPYLVPWDDLEEDIRDLDRNVVRTLPRVLAAAGLEIRRAGPVELVGSGQKGGHHGP